MTSYINQVIIEEFLHNRFNNFIHAINNTFYRQYMGLDMYHYTEDDHDWFWDNYEAFTFFNYLFNPRNVIHSNNIISQINDDYNKGMVNIYDETYIYHEYIIEYALHAYFSNKEKIKNDLINYVDTQPSLK